MELKQKGFQQFLEEDLSLVQLVSYEEFQAKGSAPVNDDAIIETVYDVYTQKCAELEKL